ncbi:MAG: DUF1553 domain-containing protein [Bryobacteraceae bacterium]
MRGFCALVFLFPAFTLAAAETIEFNRDIRPILSDKCYLCHGPDAVAKKIPLRLDSEADAKKEIAGKRAIVDGKPESSELIRRITASGKPIQMPPAYSGLKLTAHEVETLQAWIAQGARWQGHWSLIRPVRPALPPVKNATWSRNPIDAFILERLEHEGLQPSPEAGREALMRRVSLDLTGLPPTLPEIDAYLRDRSPNAYEKVVDRLLGSPRYGERMAARWLDAARYADSNGYQFDCERVMWRWRDWVIEAFNANQRFDRFTLEQIAGDMLSNATLEQKMATGFNRNHRANTEDGIIAEEYAAEYVVDRVETTSTVFLGLTLGCARCHNHKYDPFTQKEFYQVFAYFNNIPELGRAMKYGNSPPLVPAPTKEQQHELDAILQRVHAQENILRQRERSIGKARKAWERQLAGQGSKYWSPTLSRTAAFELESAEGAKPSGAVTFAPGRIGLAASFDGDSYLTAEAGVGEFDIDDHFSISTWVYPDTAPSGAVFSRMTDTEKGKGYALYLDKGKLHAHVTNNYEDDAIRMDSAELLTPRRWHHLAFTYDGSRVADGVHVYLDGKPVEFKIGHDTLYRPFRNAGKAFKEPFRIGAGGGADRRFRGRIDDLRIYSRVLDAGEIAALALGESLSEIASKPEAQQSTAEKQQLRWFYLENAAPAEIRDAWRKLGALQQEKEALERTFPTVMVMAERPARKDTYVLQRGAYDKPGEKVQPGVPAALPPLSSGAPNNRLGFAQWLIDPANPLLARVTMNRFWQMYFGTGIVKTTEDFGSQGEWPSHPALLDWLATEFVRTGWDVKAMQKLIVTSAAYKQSSKATPELVQRDPENRLFARGPRYRLPAEMVRDQALLVSGLLTEKLGGPSVKPYQPEGLWAELTMQDMEYVQSRGRDLYRRSLYTFWKRTVAPPMMANFDSALRESCVVRESRTNTPLQALNLMNDVGFLEAARFTGQRMLKEGGVDPASRLRYGFRLITSRTPTIAEEQVLRDNLQFHLDYFASNAGEVKHYLGQGDSPPDASLDKRDLAAYMAVASMIMNLDETVTKE